MSGLSRTVPRMAIVLACAASVGAAALPVLRHAAGVVVVETANVDVPTAPAAPPPDLRVIFERAPFGRAAVETPTETRVAEGLPDVTLRGVFAAASGASTALLDVDGTTELYRQDQKVTPRFTLTNIAMEYVVLTGDGQTLTLRFDTEAETAPATPGLPVQGTAEDLIARMQGTLGVPVRFAPPKPPETMAEHIDHWRKRLQRNPKAVLQDIGLRPTDNGYVIADQHDSGVRLAGLKPGDLVRRVNGQQVGNPDADRRFYDRIAASGQARLEVERNGRILTFSFPLR